MEIVASTILIFMELLAITYLLLAFFDFSLTKSNYIKLMIVGIILINIMTTYNLAFFVKFLIMIFVFNLTICRGFKGGLLSKLVVTAIGTSLNYVFDYITISIFLLTLDIGIDYLYSNNSASIILSFLSKIFVLYISFLVKKFSENKEKERISLIECLQIVIFPIVTTYIILYLFEQLLKEKTTDVRILISSVGIIFANLMLLMLIDEINKNKQIEKEHAMLKQKAELEMNTVSIIMESYKEQRKLAHDFDNHLNVIFNLGSAGKYEELMEYSKSNRKTSCNTIVVNTKNPIIDTLLSFKYKICLEKDITVTFSISDLSNLIIDNKDMIIILGNALDNAIEACDKIINKEKEIHVKLINTSNHFIMAVRNSIESVHKINLVSTKSNLIEHGYGLRNIEYILSKYKSKPVIGVVDDMFQITAIINNI